VPPLLQRHLDGEEFSIVHIIVPLSRDKTMGEEGAGVQFLVLGRTLGQDGPHSDIQSVDLHHKLTGQVWMD
jgi:hypothetical protein